MSNPPQQRLFTLEEATALLPILEPLLEDLRMKAAVLQQMQQNIQRTAQQKSSGNGHRLEEEAELRRLRGEADEMGQAVQSALDDIQSFGCEVKDMLIGLLDFRAARASRVVYLCWRLGEAKIAYWHELDTGFAGRQPL